MKTTIPYFKQTYQTKTNSEVILTSRKNEVSGKEFFYLEETSGNLTSGVKRISEARFNELRDELQAVEEAAKKSFKKLVLGEEGTHAELLEFARAAVNEHGAIFLLEDFGDDSEGSDLLVLTEKYTGEKASAILFDTEKGLYRIIYSTVKL